MTGEAELEGPSRQALAKRYAQGDLTIHELRRAGHHRMIELFADLAEIGARPPLASMIGPNVETRLAGLERLRERLKR